PASAGTPRAPASAGSPATAVERSSSDTPTHRTRAACVPAGSAVRCGWPARPRVATFALGPGHCIELPGVRIAGIAFQCLVAAKLDSGSEFDVEGAPDLQHVAGVVALAEPTQLAGAAI